MMLWDSVLSAKKSIYLHDLSTKNGVFSKKHHVFAANLVNEENQENELGSEFCNDENIVMMEWGKKKMAVIMGNCIIL